jgi:hypothetical protein
MSFATRLRLRCMSPHLHHEVTRVRRDEILRKAESRRLAKAVVALRAAVRSHDA